MSCTTDNAVAEAFLATLECELLDRRGFLSQAEARMAVFACIEGFYNPAGRHSALGYLSPTEYEAGAIAKNNGSYRLTVHGSGATSTSGGHFTLEVDAGGVAYPVMPGHHWYPPGTRPALALTRTRAACSLHVRKPRCFPTLWADAYVGRIR